ncbi:hypothetical protein CLOACE_13290 [Clostridium acetireducens DSM 10703]|jgi:hypothetical protein|uniref:Uncharacterized protein n=1 Tax=Clostridium acetireducens DSM 10703 TaxID=1121290 RepID=A0A1E8EYL4_9CLOT|nr:hypothetical protein [Clostridium acetireducens]OFI06074.1 hypothetical protein CLOACE_13290 [Clostridium acetireducens DSM 10703]
MENIIRKGIVEQVYNVYYYWSFYYSAGYLFYKKIMHIPFSNEFNREAIVFHGA